MSVPIREMVAPAPNMTRSRSTLRKRITETVQFNRPAGLFGYWLGFHETVVSPQPAGQPYPETYPQPFRSPRERPAHYLPLDRIHEDGHPDIARFTTDEFKEFHEYLTKSTEEGRSFQGSGNINLEDIANIQEKTLEGLKTPSSEAHQGAQLKLLDTLLSLCELSNLRDKKCVDFFTEAGFNEIFKNILIELHCNDQILHPGRYIGLNLLIDAAQRFTEDSPELCRQMGKNVIMAIILDELRDPIFDVEALNRDDEELKWMSRRELVKKMFTLIYNCIRNHPGNRIVLRRSRASELLKPFLDCRFYILRAKALFILAYIVTEEENMDLNTTSLNIEFIVKVLRRALEDPSHYTAHYNFFAVEVVEAVQRVAANDYNKDKFIEAGVLPHLVYMIDEKNSKEERTTALNALWMLSFTAHNKDAILNEKGCIDNVRACIGVGDYTRTCQAILWNLQDQVISRSEVKKVEDNDDKPEEKGGDGNGSNNGLASPETSNPEVDRKITPKLPHVMISYQWDVQKQIIKVKDVLKALGFNVWIDVERMGGSTLEAMANAVEEACVVIICFSEKYKDSPACRTEAEYTYKLRKDIIPLKMQTGYIPNGWLGAMLGNKFYIQMNTLDLVQENMGLLVRELADRGRYPSDEDQDVDDVYIPAASHYVQPPSPSFVPPRPGAGPPDEDQDVEDVYIPAASRPMQPRTSLSTRVARILGWILFTGGAGWLQGGGM